MVVFCLPVMSPQCSITLLLQDGYRNRRHYRTKSSTASFIVDNKPISQLVPCCLYQGATGTFDWLTSSHYQLRI